MDRQIMIVGAESEFLLSACSLLKECCPFAVYTSHPGVALSGLKNRGADLIVADSRIYDRNQKSDFGDFLKYAALQEIAVIAVDSVKSLSGRQEIISRGKALAVKDGLPVERRSGFSPLEHVLDTLPFMSFVLDVERRILFANQKAQELVLDYDKSPVPLRPGDLLGCIHSREAFAGCGTTPSCSVCGIFGAISESLESGQKATREARLLAKGTDGYQAMNVLVQVNRLLINGQAVLVLYLEDISDQKRRRELERIFFHDIINTAGGIKSLIDYLADEKFNQEEVQSLLPLIRNSAGQLLEEIRSQKDLAAAEHNELHVNQIKINSCQIIRSVTGIYAFQQLTEGKTVKIKDDCADLDFISDEVLLNRILGNLLKNALEASRKGDEVEIGCAGTGDSVVFSVKNQQVITAENQLQIFQRSFSTKGNNRGIGTYSIKLLTEKYLHGQVSFISNEQTGTVFSVELPLSGS